MIVRLCEPSIQRLRARNWNFASSGSALTASSVPKSCAVSTPFLTVSAVVLTCSPSRRFERPHRTYGPRRRSTWGAATQLPPRGYLSLRGASKVKRVELLERDEALA